MVKPGVTGDWSVRDILAHVTTWEEEALTHLPLILEGGTPPRDSVRYGGIDAFNARMTEQKARLSLSAVRRQLDGAHRRLIDFIQRAPEQQHRGVARDDRTPQGARPPARGIASPRRDRRGAGAPREGRQPCRLGVRSVGGPRGAATQTAADDCLPLPGGDALPAGRRDRGRQ